MCYAIANYTLYSTCKILDKAHTAYKNKKYHLNLLTISHHVFTKQTSLLQLPNENDFNTRISKHNKQHFGMVAM